MIIQKEKILYKKLYITTVIMEDLIYRKKFFTERVQYKIWIGSKRLKLIKNHILWTSPRQGDLKQGELW